MVIKLFILPPVHHSAQERSAHVDPNEQRCLIENRSMNTSVELGHVYDRYFTTDKATMDGIEWCWGLRRGSLHLDTRRNTFVLDISVLKLYKSRKWILIPEESVVDRYFVANKKWKPLSRSQMQELKVKETVHRYTIAPVWGMEDVSLARQSSDDPSIVKIHSYPFETMPTIISHVDPKFVILQAGSVMSCDFAPDNLPGVKEGSDTLRKIDRLYLAWTSDPPLWAKQCPEFNLPPSISETECYGECREFNHPSIPSPQDCRSCNTSLGSQQPDNSAPCAPVHPNLLPHSNVSQERAILPAHPSEMGGSVRSTDPPSWARDSR
ncbi:hypothetical protein CVT24_012837 [Panaeolus cyanescens]|uniref:Uncharacterized protein n=1 Tax=Panaeolus cyanescens TaxID=181874 RepID=A0A409W6J9_9AGAR|nr:hypothetical protein CVT24_012837 [Panaeolus cyanescens]